jgi:hypothetical protein
MGGGTDGPPARMDANGPLTRAIARAARHLNQSGLRFVEHAGVAELVDATGLGPVGLRLLEVRVLSPALPQSCRDVFGAGLRLRRLPGPASLEEAPVERLPAPAWQQ